MVKVNSNGDFLLVEVISANLHGNLTISTAVDVNLLQSHHRRTRRSSKEIDLASFQSRISHKVLIFKREKTHSRPVDMSRGPCFFG